MARRKAIEILKQRECCRECVVDNGNCNECEKAFEMAIKALEQTRWVPVRERLPEGNEKVLVCGVEAINNSRVYAVKNWDVDTWRPLSAPSVKWLAWMPLPEPYEEG